MIKQAIASAALAALFAGSALAQTPAPAPQPGTPESAPQMQAPAPAPQAPQTAPQNAPQAPQAAPGATAGVPQNPDECIQAASSLAESAEAKKLAEDKLDKIEDLLVKMETHCDAKQFNEAMAVAKDIKAMIETN